MTEEDQDQSHETSTIRTAFSMLSKTTQGLQLILGRTQSLLVTGSVSLEQADRDCEIAAGREGNPNYQAFENMLKLNISR